MYILNGREVDNIETEFEFGEGCFVISAQWADTGEELSERELIQLELDYQGELYAKAYEDLAARAYDRAKDRMKYGE